MISYRVTIDDHGLKDRMLRFMRDRIEVNRKINRQLGLVIVREAQRNLRGGNPLNVVTARLWNSVFSRVAREFLFVGTNVFYGRQHETGKTLSGETEIRPKIKKNLYIPLRRSARRYAPGMEFGKDFVLAKKVKIKKRPWLLPAIEKVLKEGAHVRIGDRVLNAHFEKVNLR
jgi:phage gpG-like protein